MSEHLEKRVVISGVGQSAIGRQVDRSGLQLTLDAIHAAVADAGLTMDDIDGLSMFPGGGAANLPGYANGNLYEVQDALRITTTWKQGVVEGLSLPFYGAAMAVATGQARHAVVWRTVKEGSAARNAGGRPAYGSTKPVAEGPLAWLLPVGMLSPVVQVAPYAMRYMHEFGVTREQLAWIPVTQRSWAARNPDAVYTKPLTVDEYLAGRMISTPISLYDCDVPCDGSTAIVVSSADTADGLRSPVRIDAMAGVVDGRPSWEQWEDMSRVGYATAAALWNRTSLRPSDVDVAELYDGFTIECVWWLEAMGFCGTGEAGAFVAGGTRIGPGGDLPLNTWGGQLSGGRLHAAFGHTAEAVRQVRGEAGARQVPGAQVAAVTNVGGYEAGAALLTRWLLPSPPPQLLHHWKEDIVVTRPGKLEGKVAIVTGAGSTPGPGIGTGKATAVIMAREGASVLLVDLYPERAQDTLAMIEAEGGKARVHAADVTKAGPCEAMVADAVGTFGGLDILVNNVGRAALGTVVDTTEEAWDQSFAINLRSAFLSSKYAVPAIAARGGGSIVNISSISALRGDGTVAYSAAKGALLAMTIDMAYSHGRQGIRVNAIAPGHITTPMVMSVSQPGPRADFMNAMRSEAGLLGTPGDGWDVGWAAAFLASDEARWITGATLPVESGVLSVTPLMMAPHLRAIPDPES